MWIQSFICSTYFAQYHITLEVNDMIRIRVLLLKRNKGLNTSPSYCCLNIRYVYLVQLIVISSLITRVLRVIFFLDTLTFSQPTSKQNYHLPSNNIIHTIYFSHKGYFLYRVDNLFLPLCNKTMILHVL